MERLNEIISRLRYVKSGDIITSADHNDLVDAIKEISEMLMCNPFGVSGINYLDLGYKLEEKYTLHVFDDEPNFLDHYCLSVKPLILPEMKRYVSTGLLYCFHVAGMPNSIFNSPLRDRLRCFNAVTTSMEFKSAGLQLGCKVLNAPSEIGEVVDYYHCNPSDGVIYEVGIRCTPSKEIEVIDANAEKIVKLRTPIDDWFTIAIATHTGVRKGYVAIADKNNYIMDMYELSYREEIKSSEFAVIIYYGGTRVGGRVVYDFMLLNYK